MLLDKYVRNLKEYLVLIAQPIGRSILIKTLHTSYYQPRKEDWLPIEAQSYLNFKNSINIMQNSICVISRLWVSLLCIKKVTAKLKILTHRR